MSGRKGQPDRGVAPPDAGPGGPSGTIPRATGPAAWERCLACAHVIGTHGVPRGRCQAPGCDCGQFAWADEGLQIASFRVCLRWLWSSAGSEPAASADRAGALAALRALGRLLGPARAQRIMAEETESWWMRTGAEPPSVGVEAAPGGVPAGASAPGRRPDPPDPRARGAAAPPRPADGASGDPGAGGRPSAGPREPQPPERL